MPIFAANLPISNYARFGGSCGFRSPFSCKHEQYKSTPARILWSVLCILQSGNHGRVCAAGAMIPLVQLAAGEARRFILLRDDGTIDVEGMSDPLRELRLDEEMIRLLGYDVDCRRFVPRVLICPEGVTFVSSSLRYFVDMTRQSDFSPTSWTSQMLLVFFVRRCYAQT